MSVSGGVSRVDTVQEKIGGTNRIIVGIGDKTQLASLDELPDGTVALVVDGPVLNILVDTVSESLDKILVELRLTNELLKGILQ